MYLTNNFYDEIRESYFKWLCDIVNDDGKIIYDHMTVLRKLFDTDFSYILEMDGNREADGIDLRYQFGKELGYEDYKIANYLDVNPCSILEVMVALSIRCENQFAYDPEYGDRTAFWFWGMVESLGLFDEKDGYANTSFINATLDRFLQRKFKKNGEGSLFTIRDPSKDMRNIDIWYQMCAYLNEVL